jgi:hypothetical protein
VPFNCTVVVGEELQPEENAEAFVAQLEATLMTLAQQCQPPHQRKP